MEKNRSKISGITLLLILMLILMTCNKNKSESESESENSETEYETVIICSYKSYGEGLIFEYGVQKFLMYLIAQNASNYKEIHAFLGSYDRDINTITMNESMFKYKLEFRKDTLNAFFMLIREIKIDLNDKVGTIFYSSVEEDVSEEEKINNACTVFESEIYDTVFNNILHVKRCFHYSILYQIPEMPPDVKYHFYYDVDRYIFVQIEARRLDTGELTYISRVEKANKIDSSYFYKNWNNTTSTDCFLMPQMCPTNEL